MFRPHPYARTCVAVTDNAAPNDSHYLFACGLDGHVHVITETYQPSLDVVAVCATTHPVGELVGMFGVEVYEAAKANLGKMMLSKYLPKAVKRTLETRTPIQHAISSVLDGKGAAVRDGWGKTAVKSPR